MFQPQQMLPERARAVSSYLSGSWCATTDILSATQSAQKWAPTMGTRWDFEMGLGTAAETDEKKGRKSLAGLATSTEISTEEERAI